MYIVEKEKKEEHLLLVFNRANSNKTKSHMMNSKIHLKLISNGNIFVDWSQLPRHQNARQCVIHYKSLNTNEVEINENKRDYEISVFFSIVESSRTCFKETR